MKKNIVIVGGGASGLMAAANLSEKINKNPDLDAKVIVVERMNKLGMKLLATGGGRCNVTNVLDERQFMQYFGKYGRFMNDALKVMSNNSLINWFAENNVPLECEDNFHYFPKSKKSSDIVKTLINKCQKNGVEFITDCKIVDCVAENDSFILTTADENKIMADFVVFSCGGVSYSKLGGNRSGYKILKKMNHNIIEPLPGMVGLKVKENWIKESTGIAFENCELNINLKKFRRQISKGELLFTHEGLSANAAINISADVAELLSDAESVPLTMKLFANKDQVEIIAHWQKLLRENSTKNIVSILAFFVPKNVAINYLKELFGDSVLEVKAAQLPKKVNLAIQRLLTECPVEVIGTAGFEKAMVTRGGVDLKNINPKTMESKIIEGIYFAGEFINLDGPCGGFNLQWAFSSGYLVGESIFHKICEE